MIVKNIDYEFMDQINNGIEKREKDRWESLVSDAKAKGSRLARIEFAILAIVLFIIAFSMETPH